MDNNVLTRNPENAIVEIKAINEDSYWTKEFDIPSDEAQKYDAAIYDLIADVHKKNQDSEK